jgi:hypothetical protein
MRKTLLSFFISVPFIKGAGGGAISVHRTDALYEERKENPSQLRIYFPPILGIYGRTQLIHIFSALIKKKIKFSSYIRKFRMEQLQSHI